ncbi:MAG: AAA family ATPase [Deltaproteobacteria bacterium]|nr:AAA family ATPase [Deltaproteobacteria bacterium]
MAAKLPLLSLGMRTFDEIRQKKAIYVDKTGYIQKLREAGKIVLLCRPRRFGKSLAVSTLDAFFSKRAELFKGLAAEEQVNFPGFAAKPVIVLDMGGRENENLETKIIRQLELNAKRYNVAIKGNDYIDSFLNLLRDVAGTSPENKAVLLIDGYDYPATSLAWEEEPGRDEGLIEGTREVLRNLYSRIGAAAEWLDFVFITGVARFSGDGVLSGLHGLTDLSLKSAFGAFMGFSQAELEGCFAPHLDSLARKFKNDGKELLGRVMDHYGGFSFDGKTRVGNPFSIISCLGKRQFGDYWLDAGEKAAIGTFLGDMAITVDQFLGREVSRGFARSPGEIEAASPEGVLYQAGYLVLQARGQESFSLNYPNQETRSSISGPFLENLVHDMANFDDMVKVLGQRLKSGSVAAVLGVLGYLFCQFDHGDQVDSSGMSPPAWFSRLFGPSKVRDVPWARIRVQGEAGQTLSWQLAQRMGDGFYLSLLLACLWRAGARATTRRHGYHDLSVLEVGHGGLRYVMGLKVWPKSAGTQDIADKALRQVGQLAVGAPKENTILLSLVMSRETRNIASGVYEKDGRLNGLTEMGVFRKAEAIAASRGESKKPDPGDLQE